MKTEHFNKAQRSGSILCFIAVLTLTLVIACNDGKTSFKDIDYAKYRGKPVQEFLDEITSLYGAYTQYSYLVDLSLFQGCKFRFFDSSHVRSFNVYVDRRKLKYIPDKIDLDSFSDSLNIWDGLRSAVDLELFKKEIIDTIKAYQYTHTEYNEYLAKRRVVFGLDSNEYIE